MSVFLTLKDIEKICFVYANQILSFNEPIPDFNTRYPEKLEAVLAMPQCSFDGIYVYNTIELQAAVLFYEIIKQHPFFNGNKRIGCVSLMTFLALNEKWLSVEWKDLYLIAKFVAKSETKRRKTVLRKLEKYITSNLIENSA